MEPVKIEGTTMHAASPEGQTASMDVHDVLEAACPRRMDTRGVVMPDGFRLAYPMGPMSIWVHEIPPRVYQLKWITADSPKRYGPGTTYRTVRIGLPYLIVLAVFEGNVLSDANECFFRVRPLEDENDELLYPALLNCSKFAPPDGKPLSWICSQRMDRRKFMAISDPARRMRAGLRELLHCLLETGFNYSSEHHEASSWFTESNQVDPRVATVDQWQSATEEDALVAIDIPWLKTNLSVKPVVERIFKNKNAGRRQVNSSADLARLIFNHQRNGRNARPQPDSEEIPF